MHQHQCNACGAQWQEPFHHLIDLQTGSGNIAQWSLASAKVSDSDPRRKGSHRGGRVHPPYEMRWSTTRVRSRPVAYFLRFGLSFACESIGKSLTAAPASSVSVFERSFQCV